jgi:hypothetical protein
VQLEEVETMKRSVLPFLTVVAVCSPVLGELVTVSFTGEVDTINNDFNVTLPAGFVLGAAVTGTYSYDTHADPLYECQMFAGPDRLDYMCFSPPALFSIEIAGYSMSTRSGGRVQFGVVRRPSLHTFYMQNTESDIVDTIPGAEVEEMLVVLDDDTATALPDFELPGAGHVLFPWASRTGRFYFIVDTPSGLAFIDVGFDVTSLTLEPPGGSCAPDGDGDGIQTSVDPNDGDYADTFTDASTNPSTIGTYLDRGDQNLCASDEPGIEGVRVESLSGGSNPATVELSCSIGPLSDIETQDLTSGECVICTCRTVNEAPRARVGWCPASPASAGSAGPAAAALPVREVELDLLRSGLVIATLVLPEGNSISYNPQTAEVTAPTSNNTTLNLVGRSGQEQPLAPGETTTVPDSAIPTVSVWGLVALTLALLVGAKGYFSRRRAAAA